jgi:uncharacterized protein YndB with AHSA1/START domain
VALLWAAWTDAKHLKEWYGPRGFTSPAASVDLRVDGSVEVEMEGPNGWRRTAVHTVVEIVPQERLVLEMTGGDRADGNFYRVHLAVTFRTEGKGTSLTLATTVIESQPGAKGPLAGTEEAWSQSMERLRDHLATIK